MDKTLSPPKDFSTWLDYAVATMDARGAFLEKMFDDVEIPAQDKIRAATQDELDHLRQKSAMPWIRILENWKTKLSQRLGRSEEVILEDSLVATDFSENGVRIQFEDGTDLKFRRAFYLGDTPSDGSIHRVAVYTEHCGYHEFWIGPSDRIEVIGPLEAQRNEIERLSRIALIENEAAKVFGTSEMARDWLTKMNASLGDTPLSMLDTETGAAEVRKILSALAYGGAV